MAAAGPGAPVAGGGAPAPGPNPVLGFMRTHWRLFAGGLITVILLVGVVFGGRAAVRYVGNLRRDFAQQVSDAQQAATDAATARDDASASAEVARTEAVGALRAANAASKSADAVIAAARLAAQARPAGTAAVASTPASSSVATTPASGSVTTAATASAPTIQVGTQKPTAPVGKVVKTAKPVGHDHPLTASEARTIVAETLARIRSEQKVSAAAGRQVRKYKSAPAPATVAAKHATPTPCEYADCL